MPRPKTHLKTKMQTALVMTYLREKGPSTKTEIIQATGIESKRFSNLTQTWRASPSEDNPYKFSGAKKGAKWAAHDSSKDNPIPTIIEKVVEKVVEVPMLNLNALECAISVGHTIGFMQDNGITTMTFGNGMIAELANNGIHFSKA